MGVKGAALVAIGIIVFKLIEILRIIISYISRFFKMLDTWLNLNGTLLAVDEPILSGEMLDWIKGQIRVKIFSGYRNFSTAHAFN